MIRSLVASYLGGAVKISIDPWGPYRERYWAIFCNEVYAGGRNFWCPASGDMEIPPLSVGQGTTLASVYAEDAGQWSEFSADDIPHIAAMAELRGAVTARRLQIRWLSDYSLTPVNGDTQLSSITITGAKRGRNLAEVPGRPTRGRLTYSITSVSTTRIVRWWADNLLVAEGSRSGDGAVSCSAMNGSGLSIACTLAYSADLAPGAAILDVRWPAAYHLHWSTASLSYPRTPDKIVIDNGDDGFLVLTPVLPAGSYNYNVLQVDDEGQTQTSISAPSDSPLTINAAPAAPTITSVAIVGTSPLLLQVRWAIGEPGCTYKVYPSLPNRPINFGGFALPGVLGPTDFDITAATVVYDVGDVFTATDLSGNYTDLADAFDATIVDGNTAFDAGESGFDTAVDGVHEDLLAALASYETAIDLSLNEYRGRLVVAKTQLDSLIDSVAGELDTTTWQRIVGGGWGAYLGTVGDMLAGEPGRYTLPNGAIAGGAAGSAAVGTGSSPDGSAGVLGGSVGVSLYAVAQPFVRPARIQIVVRATKGGIEETTDQAYEIELNAIGTAITGTRPNPAFIQSIAVTDGSTINVVAGVLEDGTASAATHVELYVSPAGVSFAPGAFQAQSALPAAAGNYHEATLSYAVVGTGWYDITVMAFNGTNQSATYITRREHIDTGAPGGVAQISAKVVRGRGVRNEEA